MMDKFQVGDIYKWISGAAVQHGGRPDMGNIDGEGYTECPQCRRDFFVKVMIREDRIEGVEPNTEKAAYIQASDVSTPSSEITRPADGSPVWKPKPRVREIGQITYNEKWDLTPQIEDLLQQLIKLGADIFSTRGGSDYTVLVPLTLSREQQDEVERLMKMLGKEVKGNVEYVDWYPHGWKFRIDPHKDGTRRAF
ncbi:MAG: hypothetical protein IPP66_20365 [Anaerolineales bacterium]|nr:hypothetical protein [Anaerolineales bacterium]